VRWRERRQYLLPLQLFAVEVQRTFLSNIKSIRVTETEGHYNYSTTDPLRHSIRVGLCRWSRRGEKGVGRRHGKRMKSWRGIEDEQRGDVSTWTKIFSDQPPETVADRTQQSGELKMRGFRWKH
jgi:hypothetical protein